MVCMHYAGQCVLSRNDRLMRLFTTHQPETRIQQGRHRIIGLCRASQASSDWHLQDTFSLSRNHKGRALRERDQSGAESELTGQWEDKVQRRGLCAGTSPSTREICFLKTELIEDEFKIVLSMFDQNQVWRLRIQRALLNVSLFMWLISFLSNWYLLGQIRTKRVGCEDFESSQSRSREG